jgi:uncharacterized hydrophobic protein (TIGR00271 family)
MFAEDHLIIATKMIFCIYGSDYPVITQRGHMSTTTLSTPMVKLGFDPEYLPAFEDKLFIEGPLTRRRLVNFFTLLIFATVIATYGVLSSSTATVIGAMIVAPLMGPIMATTAAVVMGSSPRALRALGLTVAGTLAVILSAYLLSMVAPNVTISFTNNAEIASRINPGLYALLTALGAGAAGAFITSRAEIADSMGGVAIAISLVPPLCVVGISLQQGEYNAAAGAMLLFMTNYLAILLAGGIVLLVVGLGKAANIEGGRKIRLRGMILFVVGILLVSVPLGVSTAQAVLYTIQNQKTAAEVSAWLEGTSYNLIAINVNERIVVATIEGSGELPPAQALANRLADILERPVVLNLRILPAQVNTSNSP